MVVDEQALVEYRYRAVCEVLGGSPIGEVAARFGTSRQSVDTWRRRFRDEGRPGLADRSRRPHRSPSRVSAEVESLICELRRQHPRWGARRISFELAVRGVEQAPSRVTVHRVLARNGMIAAQDQQHRHVYKRWQRAEPIHLWQLDIVGGVPLADGRSCKLVTGIDDHSRFVVVAAVVAVPTGRAVSAAFTTAMRRYGVPSEVLTDSGKQFTGRFTRPQPVEVLFERICRDNGVTARLTKPGSPTTTGKVERFHKTLRTEFLDHVAPFETLTAAQDGIDGWIASYNHRRPHQALDMAIPATMFRPNGPTRLDTTPETWPETTPTSRVGDSNGNARDACESAVTGPDPVSPSVSLVEVVEPPAPVEERGEGAAVEFEARVPPRWAAHHPVRSSILRPT